MDLKEKIFDSYRELLQVIILLIILFIPPIFKLTKILGSIFEGVEFSSDALKILMKLGDWTFGLVFMLFILFNFFRKSNKKEKLNKGNYYHNHCYCWYLFCSKILGYEKCDLKLVPIYMQFKLVIKDTFKEYLFDQDGLKKDILDKISSNYINKESSIKNIYNLILEDTYPINISKQIPNDKLDIKTIKISRNNGFDFDRKFNPDFVSLILNVVRKLPEESIIYMYSTTNPKHNFEIAKKVFSLGPRGNIKKLYIYQQEKDGERLFKKAYKIY